MSSKLVQNQRGLSRSAGVPACGLQRRPAASFGNAHRDGARTRSRGRLRYARCILPPNRQASPDEMEAGEQIQMNRIHLAQVTGQRRQ
jgi:hypothetical protein